MVSAKQNLQPGDQCWGTSWLCSCPKVILKVFDFSTHIVNVLLCFHIHFMANYEGKSRSKPESANQVVREGLLLVNV